jgi:N,N'-diacetyllegionaminate synthase
MDDKRTFVIAEAGVNHNGDLNLAKELIDAAAKAGADAVKFQTFKAEMLVSPNAPKADYQKKLAGEKESQLQMLKRLELDISAHQQLFEYCRQAKIQFLSTAFDDDSIHLLESLNLPIWKIPSGEITNYPYLKKIGSLGKTIFLSTGMATLGEIEAAIDILECSGTPRSNLVVLHCTTEYPCPYAEVNLTAMKTIADALKVRVGYSDHTEGTEVALAAVALGAAVIEKHFTLDRNLPGPDHQASIEPAELSKLVTAIRNIESSLGDGIKRPGRSEKKNIIIARKSILAKRNIKKGELLTEHNITAKRPGDGISPMRWNEIVNRRAFRDFSEDEKIEI